jgi:hypothetical protein
VFAITPDSRIAAAARGHGSVLQHALAFAVAVIDVAFVAACAAQSGAPLEVAAPPHLVIALEGEFSPSSGKTPAAFEGVPARLQLGGASAPATLDLRAWPPAPVTGRKPQIDVRMRKKRRLFGMRRFSLRDPAAVAFQDAPIQLEHLRREGVLATRILFVRVSVDGVDLGPMAVVEHLSKELLESQQRREGVLFRLRQEDLPVARIDVFGAKKIADSKQLSIERATAAGLLQAFLRGDLPARDVFDEEIMARFLAVAELWQADAWLRPEGLRFYFNPLTQRLEPVATSDGLWIPPDPGARLVSVEGWPSRLLADAWLRSATLRNLHRLADEMTSGAAPRWVAAEEERVLRDLRAEVFARPAIAFDPWIARARRLATLRDADFARERALLAHDRSAGRDRLIAAPDVASRPRNPVPGASLDEVLKRHPFLEWDASQRALRAAPGAWTVSGSLVLPEGVGLDLVAGTTLRFGEGEMLLSSGPLRFRGSAADPVVLEGLPAEASAGTWQGLVVLRSEAPHVWDHVVVRNTTGIDRDGWRLTGGVSIRASQARIENSSFSGNRAEDAVNLIRSGFEFRGVSIRDALSDAFDCDFCEGRVTGGRISDVGGDGIDVSGSVVQVDGVAFERIRDKAISVGAGSRLIARDVDIREVGTAVAGKDGSVAIFEDSEVSDVRHAVIMAYTKKHEYGPGRVDVHNIRMKRFGRAAVAQHGSRILIDGVEQVPEDVDVEALYEREYMKK